MTCLDKCEQIPVKVQATRSAGVDLGEGPDGPRSPLLVEYL